MQDRPTAQELVEAVADFIAREINPTQADQRLRFRGLIASNVLAIVSRELASGDGLLRAEWHRLGGLSDDSETTAPADTAALRDAVQQRTRDLCARIRAGEVDDQPFYGAALAHARATVVEKLTIANPRFLERVGI